MTHGQASGTAHGEKAPPKDTDGDGPPDAEERRLRTNATVVTGDGALAARDVEPAPAVDPVDPAPAVDTATFDPVPDPSTSAVDRGLSLAGTDDGFASDDAMG
jgi:hypothetical protein